MILNFSSYGAKSSGQVLTGDRIYLRAFKIEDLGLLRQLHQNPQVAKSTIDSIQSNGIVKKHLVEFIDHQKQYGFSQMAVFERENNKFIGRAGLTKRALNAQIGQQVEIRFAFLPEFWGCGFASESCEVLINFANNNLKLSKIAAANSTVNESSAKVLTKFGFKHIQNIIPQGYGKDEETRYWELEL